MDKTKIANAETPTTKRQSTEQTGHTRGPWHISRTNNGWCIASLGTGIALTIPPDDRISEANARLIAAAPELFTACVRLVLAADHSQPIRLIENISEAVDKARSAISKVNSGSGVPMSQTPVASQETKS